LRIGSLALPRLFWLAFIVLPFVSGCGSTSAVAPLVQPIASEKYSSIVVDAGSGEILHQYAADAPRYPASLTKMMTLYLLFEAIDSGILSPTSRITASAYAASRPPSKLGLRPGDSFDVQTAILALCVKSANDVAAAVAEHLGGTEQQFAGMMTAKARQLGMRSTVFTNASGLPDSGQMTTARDMALLALALHNRFPHHYHVFANQSFAHEGRTIKGHNDLLGRVDGVDGIKTGYIRASGYNIATSAARGRKRIVVIVMGGDTAKSRNAHVERLLEAYLPQAKFAAVR